METSCVRQYGLGGIGGKDLCRPDISFFAVERIFFNGGDEEFYHICTDGASLDWMFQDNSDFIAGVNRSAVCAILSGVKLFSFVLMDNHVHFVVRGSMPSCKDFIVRFKNLTGRYIFARYKIKGYLRSIPTEIIRISTPDRLLATLAYLDRNPMVAGWRRMPDEYPWGIARFLFRAPADTVRFRRLDSFSRHEQCLLLGTHQEMPQDWLIDENGMLDPRYFVDIASLEKIYRTPGRYLYFLSKKLEGDVERYFSENAKPFVQDKELRVVVGKLASELFGEADLRMLSVNSRLKLARKLRYEYGSSVKQISRMLHLDVEVLKGFV